MTCQPYHDLPPDPTGRLPRGIGWKVSPSGRLRSGWAFRGGRYTSDWSASERTCANNWRNRGEIPSKSPLGGYSSLALATTIIGRRRRACLPQTLRRMMDRTMRTSTRLFAKALGLAIATTAALCITPNALSQDTGLLALPQEPPIEDPIDDLPGDPIPCSPDLIIVEPGEKVTILFEPPLQTAPSEVLVYETIIGQFIETTPSMITWIPTHCGWDYIQVRAVDEDGNSRVIVRLDFTGDSPELSQRFALLRRRPSILRYLLMRRFG